MRGNIRHADSRRRSRHHRQARIPGGPTGRGLLALCGIATLGAFANGISIMATVAPERLMSEAWRTVAYLVFVGLYVMLAVAPRTQRGTWELVFVHKIAIVAFAITAGDTTRKRPGRSIWPSYWPPQWPICCAMAGTACDPPPSLRQPALSSPTRPGHEFAHPEEGLAKALARLRTYGLPAGLPVAIETSRGLAVDRLLAAGRPVVPVHSNAFNAMRARWGASKAKTDAGDSMKLADYLRTDGHVLSRLEPAEQATMDLQALTRQRANHVEAKIVAVIQLAALLDTHWPGGNSLFTDLDSDIAVACEQLIAEAGVVPVTRALGKSRVVAFRFATNRRTRLALAVFADNGRHGSDWAAKIYNDARARTKRHPHAVRILARARLRVMWACWRDGACYDPVTHQANGKATTAAEEPSPV